MHGQGSFVWKNGSQYVGEFLHGERSGSGKQIWKSGQYYIGEWKHGHPEGKGILINPNASTSNEVSDGDENTVQTIGIWDANGLVKELIVGKKKSSSNNADTSDEDDVPIFESIKTTLQTRKAFPQE